MVHVYEKWKMHGWGTRDVVAYVACVGHVVYVAYVACVAHVVYVAYVA